MPLNIVGITGRSGAGKNYVCDIFSEYKVPSVDTDKIYRELCSPVNKNASELVLKICEAFGEEAACPGGELNRRYISGRVYKNEGERRRLCSITHPAIIFEAERKALKYLSGGAIFVLINAPLLFEAEFSFEFLSTIAVSASDKVLVERITKRDNILAEDALKRLRVQASNSDFSKRCEFTIVNDGDEYNLREQIDIIYMKIRERISGGI